MQKLAEDGEHLEPASSQADYLVLPLSSYYHAPIRLTPSVDLVSFADGAVVRGGLILLSPCLCMMNTRKYYKHVENFHNQELFRFARLRNLDSEDWIIVVVHDVNASCL